MKINQKSFNRLKSNNDNKRSISKHPTYIFALGGIEEIGKNTYCIEHEDEILIIDCGIKFANDDLLGVDGIVANYSYLVENNDKVKALVISHGHEDHIGGIPHLLREIKCPVIYAPKIAAELIKKKLSDFTDIKLPNIVTYYDDSVFSTKYFKIDFCRVSHSIPDAFAIAVETPNGNILHSGDYRIDFCLEGEQANLQKMVEIGNRDLAVLMTETTNSEVSGFSPSENEIYKEINNILANANGRVFFSTFASNLSRVERVIEIALNYGRKICLLGKAMENNVDVARRIGYLDLKDDDLVSPKEINNLNDNEVFIICTGSQGEEMAALNSIASKRHIWISFKPTDTIVLSSNPIPGNWMKVQHLINKFYKYGLTVLENGPDLKLHASGHATVQEQQLILELLRPRYIIPIHGEFKMLRAIQNTAESVFIPKENVFILKNGWKVKLFNNKLEYTNEVVDAEPVFIEGKVAGETSNRLMNIRRVISEEGVVFVAIVIDKKTNKVVHLPTIVTRGCFYAKASTPLIAKISYSIKAKIEQSFETNKNLADKEIDKLIKNVSSYFIWKNKKRSPLIISSIFYL